MKFHPILCLTALVITGLVITGLANAQPTPENPLVRHIPADADKVFHINYNILSGKLDWQVLGPAIFKKEEDRPNIKYLTDPTQLGIDPRAGIFVAQSNVLKVDSPRYTTLLFALADSAKFIQFIRTDHRPSEGKLIIHPGKPRTAIQGKTVFAWNDKMIAVTFTAAPISHLMTQKGPNSPAKPDAAVLRYLAHATRRSVAALRGFENSLIAADPDFRTAIADDADAHIYSRFGGGFGIMADMMRITHAPVGKDLLATMERMKHSHMHSIGTIRFDNGQLSMRTRFFNDSLAGLDLGLRPVNTSLIERLPEGNLLGLFALHIDPMALTKIIQHFAGARGIKELDSSLAKKGLTIKDLLSAFKGDLLVAAIDKSQPIPATDSTPAKPAKPSFYIVLTIADPTAFDKVNDRLHLVRDSASTAAGDSPAGDSVKPKKPLAHTLRDNILVLGPDKQATDDFFNKPGRGPSRLVSEEVRTSPFAVVIDMKAITTYLKPMLAGSSPKNQQAKAFLDLFDQITLTAGKTQGKEIETLFDIKLTDTQQNSLTILSRLIPSLSGR